MTTRSIAEMKRNVSARVTIDVEAQKLADMNAVRAFTQQDPLFLLNGAVLAPRWTPDSSANKCQAVSNCGRVFTTFDRRHHCRFCGLLVCGACSQLRLASKAFQRAQRCCQLCFSRLSLLTDMTQNLNNLQLTMTWMSQWKQLLKPFALRLTFVGDRAVGKSALCHRLAEDAFLSEYAQTHAVVQASCVQTISALQCQLELFDLPGNLDAVSAMLKAFSKATAAEQATARLSQLSDISDISLQSGEVNWL